jgi:hypothetical protein
MANPRHVLSGGCVAGVEDLNEEDVTETESPAVTAAITAAITTPFGYKVRDSVSPPPLQLPPRHALATR